MSETLAFIFARGGSKGVPGKNIRPLGGKPLIAWSIDLARDMHQFSRVFVSTDSEAIAAVARDHGAEVLQRPAHLATDTARETLAWQHHVRELQTLDGYPNTTRFVSLPATSPLRSAADVEGCLALYGSGQYDLVVTGSEARNSPYFNMLKLNEQGLASVVLPGNWHRRQDAPAVYDMTAVAYVTSFDYILNMDTLMAGKVGLYCVEPENAVDIDTEFDFRLAEFLLQDRSR